MQAVKSKKNATLLLTAVCHQEVLLKGSYSGELSIWQEK